MSGVFSTEPEARYKNILEDIVKRNGLDIEYKTFEELEDGFVKVVEVN